MAGVFRRRRLPHWDVADATYFVTACLEGSIPTHGLESIREYRRELDARSCPPAMTPPEWEHHKHKLVFAKIDKLLDGDPVVRHLEQPWLASEVRTSLYHFAGTRYHLLAYVVMPSHLHWVFHPIPKWCESLSRRAGFQPARHSAKSRQAGSLHYGGRRPKQRTPREVIMHSIKSFTGNCCNKLLGSDNEFWQAESYDHWVRDDDELLRIIDYVEQNPVVAGLCETPEAFAFSSARDRAAWGIPHGQPLVPPK
ncbi:MAG: hypothetical protein RIC55_14575 [Pirellulaceae bacterium]